MTEKYWRLLDNRISETIVYGVSGYTDHVAGASADFFTDLCNDHLNDML